jgi:hypothetical protein
MKTNSLQISAVLAAIVVAALFPISVTAACTAACAAGLIAIICADYGRNLEPLRAGSPVTEFYLAVPKHAGFREAA